MRPLPPPLIPNMPADGRYHWLFRVTQHGAESQPGNPCPYDESQLAYRCAWLAGHYDTHGYRAWLKARR